MTDWPMKLLGGLVAWQRNQSHQAVNEMSEALALLPVGGDSDLWRVLIENHLALVLLSASDYAQATHHHERAKQIWASSGLRGAEEIRPNLEWFAGLLRTAGLDREAEQLLHTLASDSPLIDLWAGSGPQAMVPLGGLQGARVQGSLDRGFEPMGGRTLEASASGPITVPNWQTGITSAMRLLTKDKSKEALRYLESVRQLAAQERRQDFGLRLLWTHNAEVLTHFLSGDYPAADRSRNEAQQLWPSLSLNPQTATDPLTEGFWRLLEQVERPDLAVILKTRLASGQCPILNPWEDLQTAIPDRLAAGEALDAPFEFAQTIDESFRILSSVPTGTQLPKLSSLRQRFLQESEPSQVALSLIEHLSSLLAYSTGDYAQAETLIQEAEGRWLRIGAMERLRGPWLEVYRESARGHQMDAFVEGLPQKLFSPFDSGVQGWRKSGGLEKEEEPAEPSEAWMVLLKEAWSCARSGEHSVAVRYASRAEKRAREISADDLRVCYAINSQSIFCQMLGSYAESDGLWHDCLQMWRRGATTTLARTAWNDFCDVLEESKWLDLAETLRQRWAKPDVRPEQALLDPREDVDAVQMTRLSAALPEVEPPSQEPEPEVKQRGWFQRVFGKKA